MMILLAIKVIEKEDIFLCKIVYNLCRNFRVGYIVGIPIFHVLKIKLILIIKTLSQ